MRVLMNDTPEKKKFREESLPEQPLTHSVGTGMLTHKGYVPANWSVEYKELYTLPYLKHRWREDFQITDFPITTHGKYIFRNELKS